jgi:hypothetical protein
MSTTTAPSRVDGENLVVVRVPTLAWALRRTVLGILILFVSIAFAACLLYASIDPDEETSPAATPATAGHSLSAAPFLPGDGAHT